MYFLHIFVKKFLSCHFFTRFRTSPNSTSYFVFTGYLHTFPQVETIHSLLKFNVVLRHSDKVLPVLNLEHYTS